MRKFVFPFLIFLMFIVGVGDLFAQNTFPLPNTFPFRPGNYNPSITNLVKFPSNLVLRSTDLKINTYPVDYGNAVDSVYFPQTSWTGLEGETRYIVKVDSFGQVGVADDSSNGVDSLAFITIRKITYRLDSTAFRRVWLNQVNRNVIDSLGFTFNRTNISEKDEFEVDLTYDRLALADTVGRLLVNVSTGNITVVNTVPIPIRLEDSLGNNLEIDSTSRTLVVLGEDQHHVHEQEAFWISDTSGGGSGDSLSMGITIPDTNIQYHMVISAKSNVAATYVLFEDAAFTGGTAITVKNRDRNSSDSSGVIIVKDPTITGHGTTLSIEIFDSGNKAGGISHELNEFIAKNNTKYVAIVYFDAASAFGGLVIEFYGHVPY